MTLANKPTAAVTKMVSIDGAEFETVAVQSDAAGLVVAAAHPADNFGTGTATLIAGITGTPTVCINPPGLGYSPRPTQTVTLEQMVDGLEATRTALGLAPWVFWGMSGGGWLGMLYAHRHPHGLAGLIVESICLCFRERLADPTCAISPFFPAWTTALKARGMLQPDTHAAPSTAQDTCWEQVPGVGEVFRRRNGPALLVSPTPASNAMRAAMPQLWTFDARSWIGTVQTPTLVMAGDADPVAPLAHVRAVHQAIAGSRWAAMQGGSHVPSVHEPGWARNTVRTFLATLHGHDMALQHLHG